MTTRNVYFTDAAWAAAQRLRVTDGRPLSEIVRDLLLLADTHGGVARLRQLAESTPRAAALVAQLEAAEGSDRERVIGALGAWRDGLRQEEVER